MIRIRQLKLKIDHTEANLKKKICQNLRVKEDALLSYKIRKQSLDARKKPDLFYVYMVDVWVKDETKVIRKIKSKDITRMQEVNYHLPDAGDKMLASRPVVVGSGPAGMFCAYILAEAGYRPILLERGGSVEERTEDVKTFWETGMLKPESNVQFGEGGAGTFSDGKLNTLVKDSFGRNQKVLEIFVKHGAPKEILIQSKPHIGTDILSAVVKNMRNHILAHGGEIRFHHQMKEILLEKQKLIGLGVYDAVEDRMYQLPASDVILAIGHSARDTFSMLYQSQLEMQAKPFAVGVRVQHKQEMVNEAQYGKGYSKQLPAANYSLKAALENGRSVYTFCMCPGGYVVDASSEQQMLAVNGMSYHDRAGENANSAVIVSITPKDYPGEDALSGVAFQRMLEKRAYEAGNGKIPVQLFGDYRKNQSSQSFGKIQPAFRGQYTFADVRGIFPKEIADSIEEGLLSFDHKLPGYAEDDVILAGVESRTSSPVKMLRDQTLQSNIRGLYPCGEGAGYAGGITSAAMDGIKVAEQIVMKYRPFDINTK